MDAAENTNFYGFQPLMGYGVSRVHSWRYFKCDVEVLIGEGRGRGDSTFTPICDVEVLIGEGRGRGDSTFTPILI
jgi:hypothetical protein